MSATYDSFKILIDNIIIGCKGWVESVAIVAEDGTPVAYSAHTGFNPEFIAAATAAIGGAVNAVMDLLNATRYNKIEIELNDRRYIIIRNYKDRYYIVALTKPKPNLGFINLIIEAYVSGKS